MKKASLGTKTQGFSLLEMAIVLVIAGLMVGMVNRTQTVVVEPSGCYAETKKQLATIHDALVAFERKNQRLPIPAGRSLGSTNPNFGRETNLGTSLANIDRLSNGNNLLFGALPFQALGLSEYYAADCWGNKFSYVVTEKMTNSAASGGYPDIATVGGITLKSSSAVTVADASAGKGLSYVVTSHGESAVGAVKKNYSSASHGWCTAPTAAEAIDKENCDITGNTLVTTNFNNGSTAGAAFYDDLVTFSGKLGTGTNPNSGRVFAWGPNYFGMLGDNTTTQSNIPVAVQLPAGMKFVQVSPGAHTSCVLSDVGTVYCWGNAPAGLGDAAHTTYSKLPVLVDMSSMGGVKFTKISGFAALGDDNNIYSWGDNSGGGFGNGTTLNSWKPTKAETVTLPAGVKFKDFSTGVNTVCALGTDDKAYCWGYQGFGVPNNCVGGSGNEKFPKAVTMPAGITFKKIVTGYLTACATGNDDKLYCWGNNNFGALGNGAGGCFLAAARQAGPVTDFGVSLGKNCNVASGNQLWCSGADLNGAANPTSTYATVSSPASITSIKQITTSDGGSGSPDGDNFHMCMLGNDDQVYCKGVNDEGQLGNGTTSYASSWTPLHAPTLAALGITGFTQVVSGEKHHLAIAK